MDEYIAFLVRNWPLSLAFLLTLIVIIFVELRERQGGAALSATDAVNCMNRDKGVVIDIRAASDYESGHIIDAVNVDPKAMADQVKKLKKYTKRPLIVADQNGKTTGAVVKFLAQEGFTVFALAGGIDAWLRDDLPLSKQRGE